MAERKIRPHICTFHRLGCHGLRAGHVRLQLSEMPDPGLLCHEGHADAGPDQSRVHRAQFFAQHPLDSLSSRRRQACGVDQFNGPVQPDQWHDLLPSLAQEAPTPCLCALPAHGFQIHPLFLVDGSLLCRGSWPLWHRAEQDDASGGIDGCWRFGRSCV